MKQIIGWALISLPFILLTIAMYLTDGMKCVLFVWGFCVAIVAIVVVTATGMYLIS